MDITFFKLHFPSSLILRIEEYNSGDPIPKIIVALTFFAGRKNDYHVRPAPSNSEGLIVVSRQWVRDAIDYTRNTFIMDYATVMDECKSNVEIRILSTDELDKASHAMKIYGVENGCPSINHTMSDLRISNNRKYEPMTKTIELSTLDEVTRNVIIRLRRMKDYIEK